MAVVNLYCLPYSGASAMVYSRWRRKLPEWLVVRPVELPGRGVRFGEPLQTDLHALARQLAQELMPELQHPYALFGHSLGALLAFELTHALRELGCPPPLILFASGTAAPTRREDYEKGYTQAKSDAELISELRELQGTSEEILANQELMSLTLPILRADFLLCGRYCYRQPPRLAMPLHVLGGKADRSSLEQLQAWGVETASDFALHLFEGGHFFIHEHEPQVLQTLVDSLSALPASVHGRRPVHV